MPSARVPDVNGFVEVKDNPLSRVGVFPYSGRQLGLTGPDADRILQVYRPEEELSDPECLASFRLLPWVDDHTMLGEGATPAEQKGVSGVIGENVYFDSGVLYGNIKVFSDSLARLIEAGKRQLSAGYRCVYEFTAGTFNGQRYDAIQRQIRGNHLALVQEGRMGPSVAVRDSLTFTFDASEANIMAGENKDGTPGAKDGEGDAGEMTLAAAIAMLKQLAPQVAALTEAMGKATATPAAAAATPDAAAAAATTPAAATPAAPDAALAGAMDAALKPLREQVEGIAKTMAAITTAMDGMAGKIATDTAARDKLAKDLTPHVGVFDHADKTLAQVAAYGCEKIGLKPAAGTELVAVTSWLHGRPDPLKEPTVRTSGMDSAPLPEGSKIAGFISGAKATA